MADTALVKKLLVKPGMRLAVLSPPPGYLDRLAVLPAGAAIAAGAGLEFVQVFGRTRAELTELLPEAYGRVKPDGIFWVCYPKLSGGRAADLSRESVWAIVSKLGLRPVAQVALDADWSALRFRPASSVKSGGPGPAAARPKAIDRTVVVPSDLRKLLAKNRAARERFAKLSFTHRKEYVAWIEEAKKPETRARRLAKTLEMLGSRGSR